MFFILRFVVYFTISFAILSIPIGNNRQLFNLLSSLVSPYATDAVESTKQKISTTTHYSKKLYSNSEPNAKVDQVKTKMAGIKKAVKEAVELPEDTYTEEEQERLRRVLNDD